MIHQYIDPSAAFEIFREKYYELCKESSSEPNAEVCEAVKEALRDLSLLSTTGIVDLSARPLGLAGITAVLHTVGHLSASSSLASPVSSSSSFSLSSIRALNFVNCELDDTCAELLLERLPQLQQLTQLDLSYNFFTSKTFPQWAQLISSATPPLRSFSYSGNSVSSESIISFFTELSSPQSVSRFSLQKLALKGIDLDDFCVPSVINFFKLTPIREINLKSNSFCIAEGSELASSLVEAITSCRTLQQFDADSSSISGTLKTLLNEALARNTQIDQARSRAPSLHAVAASGAPPNDIDAAFENAARRRYANRASTRAQRNRAYSVQWRPPESVPEGVQENSFVRVGCAETRGKRPTMEDKTFVDVNFRNRGETLICCFDGHGGSQCAEYLERQLPLLLAQKLDQVDSWLPHRSLASSLGSTPSTSPRASPLPLPSLHSTHHSSCNSSPLGSPAGSVSSSPRNSLSPSHDDQHHLSPSPSSSSSSASAFAFAPASSSITRPISPLPPHPQPFASSGRGISSSDVSSQPMAVEPSTPVSSSSSSIPLQTPVPFRLGPIEIASTPIAMDAPDSPSTPTAPSHPPVDPSLYHYQHSGSSAASMSTEQLLAMPEGEREAICKAIHDAFMECAENIYSGGVQAGSTAAILYVRDKRIYSANCGDTRVVVCRNSGNPVRLSRDHRPEVLEEVERIRSVGGFIVAGRVGGMLAVARSFGDGFLRPSITAEPDIFVCDVDQSDEFVVVACDGLWDYVSEKWAMTVARPEMDPMVAATKLRDFALMQASTDNISVVVCSFKHRPPLQHQ